MSDTKEYPDPEDAGPGVPVSEDLKMCPECGYHVIPKDMRRCDGCEAYRGHTWVPAGRAE